MPFIDTIELREVPRSMPMRRAFSVTPLSASFWLRIGLPGRNWKRVAPPWAALGVASLISNVSYGFWLPWAAWVPGLSRVLFACLGCSGVSGRFWPLAGAMFYHTPRLDAHQIGQNP